MTVQGVSNDDMASGRYQQMIDRIYPSTDVNEPRASVVIVCFRTPVELLLSNIEKLKDGSTEMIVVDNSAPAVGNPFVSADVTYVAMKGNSGVCVARNLGASLASSNIVIFLDDDAVPGDGFVDAHVKEQEDPSVLAVRGKCLPKTHNLPNRLAFHYDLGPERIPSPMDLEGNSSFKRKELLACGGFNEELPLSGGWEGVEVSRRLVQMSGDLSSVIYSPYPIIYHDYKSNSFQLLTKLMRHRRNLGQMSQGQEGLSEFFDKYPREKNPLQRIKKAVLTYR
jgi:GT2 family glycosyltransferase